MKRPLVNGYPAAPAWVFRTLQKNKAIRFNPSARKWQGSRFTPKTLSPR